MNKLFQRNTGSAKAKNNKNMKLVQSIDLSNGQIFESHQIQLGQKLGEGGFATVYHCKLEGESGGQQSSAVAKVIAAEKLNEEMTYLLTNECTIWARLAHPNIVTFLGMAATPTTVLLCCELLPDGSLQEQLARLRKSHAPPPQILDLVVRLHQVATGMEYLHALDPPVLHRDLKSANILLKNGGSHLAIADFGLARYQANAGSKMTAETGSYRWMAPEVIRHEEYDKRCDVYSYAILAWEMLTYKIPFDNMMPVEAAFAVAREARRPPIPTAYQALPIAEMLHACWHQDAKKRPPFTAICTALEEEMEMLKGESQAPVSLAEAPA